jgi:hypothetical protein
MRPLRATTVRFASVGFMLWRGCQQIGIERAEVASLRGDLLRAGSLLML